MQVPFLDLKAQYLSIKHEILPAIENILDNTAYILGPSVENFERSFAEAHQSQFAVGLNSGTSALQMALLAAGVGPGDEVITVPMTFAATIEAILMVGATPRFVDVEEQGGLMNADLLEAAMTPKTKAVIPVHLYGQVCDMDPILAVCKPRGVVVIEDACQAHLATYKGRKAGSIGDAGCFSFYPGKNLGAYGEAGATTTNNADWNHTMRCLRDHGQAKKYEHKLVGFNTRMEGFHGAVLGVKMRHLAGWTAARRERAAWYNEGLKGLPLALPHQFPDREHSYHLYTVRTPQRAALQAHLADAGIGTGFHYPIALNKQPAFEGFSWAQGSFPVSEKLAGATLSLPMYAELTRDQVNWVCEQTKAFYARG
jgi:dTDP-4-amino-4,6-dideoxygalactose transaminase